MSVVAPPEQKDFALLFVEFHKVPVSHFFQPDEVPLDGNTTTLCNNNSVAFCTLRKLAEGTLCPISEVTNEDVKQDWTQY